jgi:hypothetical protein
MPSRAREQAVAAARHALAGRDYDDRLAHELPHGYRTAGGAVERLNGQGSAIDDHPILAHLNGESFAGGAGGARLPSILFEHRT